MMTTITLRGVLNWNGRERRTDRYGGICLLEWAANVNEGEEARCISLAELRPLIRRTVTLAAKVLEVRESYHVGDLFREIKPSTPAVGEVLELGRGELVDVEIVDGIEQFLFRREHRRQNDVGLDGPAPALPAAQPDGRDHDQRGAVMFHVKHFRPALCANGRRSPPTESCLAVAAADGELGCIV